MTTPWLIAKELLKEDIISGYALPSMGPEEVAELRWEYERVPFKNFKVNLNRLRKDLDNKSDLATNDDFAVAHDRRLHPVSINPPGFSYPRWNGSEAERLLKIEVDNGSHARMPPRALHKTEGAYQCFPIGIFRNHIYQEVRSRRETPYWLAKKAAIKRKKDKKKNAAARAAGLDIGEDEADDFAEAELLLE